MRYDSSSRPGRFAVIAGLMITMFAPVTVASAGPHSTLESSQTPSRSAALFLSPTGSDKASCSTRAPCLSFARAYQLADLGDVVELAAGTYPDQLLEGKSAKAPDVALAERVVFRPAAGAQVEIGRMEVNVPHVEFRNMRIAKWKARYNVEDTTRYAAGNLVFRNIRTHHFSFNAVHNVSVIGGEVGPNRNPETGDHPQDGIFIGAYPADVRVPTNILLDGVYIHDVTEPNADAHSDCIQFTAGVNVTIRNNRFRNCEHADMMIKGDQGPIENFLIENNFLDRTLSAYYSINIYETSRGCRNVLMRNNTALQNIRTDACSGATLTGNIQPSMSSHKCSSSNGKMSHNVYESGVTCGEGDLVAPVAYVDRAGFDLRLASGSAAIARGNSNSAPRRDIDGNVRPTRWRPDAGAHQRDTAAIGLGISIGNVRLGGLRAGIEEFYGRGRQSRVDVGLTKTTFRVPGGALWVIYAGDRAVGVGTSSPYYATAAGVGPGSSAGTSGLPWDACRKAYRRAVRSVRVYLAPVGAKPGRPVASLLMVRRNADTCRSASRD